MKTTIIFLGLAVLNFTNGKAANELNAQDLVQQEVTTVGVDNAQQQNQLVLVNKEISKINFENTSGEAVVFNQKAATNSTSAKALDQVIAEDKLITGCEEEVSESTLLDISFEEVILEGNQIIESNPDNEVYPLDFEKINRLLKNNKACNNNMAVTIDLKL
jgi:hypothetical protein